MKTNDLKKLVKERIDPICPAWHRKASNTQAFPYAVFEMKTVQMDAGYDRILLTINLWNKDKAAETEELADRIEKALDRKNLPQERILPTVYGVSRENLEDEKSDIVRIELRFEIQTYEKEEL